MQVHRARTDLILIIVLEFSCLSGIEALNVIKSMRTMCLVSKTSSCSLLSKKSILLSF